MVGNILGGCLFESVLTCIKNGRTMDGHVFAIEGTNKTDVKIKIYSTTDLAKL